jgi:hypothetical protein
LAERALILEALLTMAAWYQVNGSQAFLLDVMGECGVSDAFIELETDERFQESERAHRLEPLFSREPPGCADPLPILNNEEVL